MYHFLLEICSNYLCVFIFSELLPLVMAALWNRAGHYIFAQWFLRLASFFLA